MNRNARWITETAIMLALLVTLQALTKPLGQMVTGSFVNTVLAVTVLFAGLSAGITVSLISPVLAYMLGIAPQILTVPAIMVGNTIFVVCLYYIAGVDSKKVFRQVIAWLVAAGAKFAALYTAVSWLICGVLAEKLLASGVLKPPMLKVLPVTFGLPQLFTALIGGAVALLIVPVLRRAMHK